MTYRSRKLLDTAKDCPYCFGCGNHNDGTVVMAHANWYEYGKGGALKANDWAIAAMCFKCHTRIDQGHDMDKAEKKEFWRMAHVKTLTWLFDTGRLGFTG